MTNQQFTEHISGKLEALNGLAPQDRPEDFKDQEELLTSALKIMTYGTGPERRRFRRDYERRLAK